MKLQRTSYSWFNWLRDLVGPVKPTDALFTKHDKLVLFLNTVTGEVSLTKPPVLSGLITARLIGDEQELIIPDDPLIRNVPYTGMYVVNAKEITASAVACRVVNNLMLYGILEKIREGTYKSEYYENIRFDYSRPHLPLLYHASDQPEAIKRPSPCGSNKGECGRGFYLCPNPAGAIKIWDQSPNPRTGKYYKYVNVYTYDNVPEILGGSGFICNIGGQVVLKTMEEINMLHCIDCMNKRTFVHWIECCTLSLTDILKTFEVSEEYDLSEMLKISKNY